jgi:hypothetical protein
MTDNKVDINTVTDEDKEYIWNVNYGFYLARNVCNTLIDRVPKLNQHSAYPMLCKLQSYLNYAYREIYPNTTHKLNKINEALENIKTLISYFPKYEFELNMAYSALMTTYRTLENKEKKPK